MVGFIDFDGDAMMVMRKEKYPIRVCGFDQVAGLFVISTLSFNAIMPKFSDI